MIQETISELLKNLNKETDLKVATNIAILIFKELEAQEEQISSLTQTHRRIRETMNEGISSFRKKAVELLGNKSQNSKWWV